MQVRNTDETENTVFFCHALSSMAFVDNSSLLTGCANAWIVPGTLTTQKIKLPNAPAFTGSLSTLQNDAGFITGQGNSSAVSLGNVTAVGGVNLPGSQAMNLGSDQTKALNAGTLAYQSATPGAVDMFGAGTSVGSRNLKLWDNVDVDGTLKVGKGCRPLQIQENAMVTGLGFQDGSLNNLPTPVQNQVLLSNLSPYAGQSNAGSLYFPTGQNYISYANTSPVNFDWTASNSSFECWANFPRLPTSNVALLGVGNPNSNTNYWSLNVANTGVASMVSQTSVTTTATAPLATVTASGDWLQLQSNVAMPIQSYTTFFNNSVFAWVLLGSQDGITWTLLHSIAGVATVSPGTTFGVVYPGSYFFFRMVMTQASGQNPLVNVTSLNFNPGNTFVSASTLPPVMTSNTAPAGYTATASSTTSSNAPWRAFDQATNTSYSGAGGYDTTTGAYTGQYTGVFTTNYTTTTVQGEWLQLQSATPIPITSYTFLGAYTNATAYGTIGSWTLLGSQDANTWNTLHSVSLTQAPSVATSYTVTNSGTYSYIRFVAQGLVKVSNVTISNPYAGIDVLSFESGGSSVPPAMTSNTTPSGYTVSASNVYVYDSYNAWRAFDKVSASNWLAGALYSNAGTYFGSAATSNIGGTIITNIITAANVNTVNNLTLTSNTWSHLALTYQKPLALQSLFINGTLASTVSNVVLSNAFATSPFVINGLGAPSTTPLYLTDVRATRGELAYAGNSFAVPTQPLTATANTQLLLRAQRGTNGVVETGGLLCGANTIVDVSQNNYNPLPVLAGNTYVASDLSPYSNQNSTGSVYLASNTAVTYTGNAYPRLSFDIRTQDMTAEAWLRPNSATDYTVFTRSAAGSNVASVFDWSLIARANGQTVFQVANTQSSSQTITGNTSAIITPGAWNHVVATVFSGNVFLYTNGVCVGNSSVAVSGNAYSPAYDLSINRPPASAPAFITDVRVQRGLAAYTGNFTPPTQPLQATANTQLLLRAQRGIVITNNQGAGSTQTTVAGNVQVAGSVSASGAVTAGNLNQQLVKFNATSTVATYVSNIPCNTLGGGTVIVTCSWASSASVGQGLYVLQQYNDPYPTVWTTSSTTVLYLGGNSNSWTFTNVGGFFAIATQQVGINNYNFSINHN